MKSTKALYSPHFSKQEVIFPDVKVIKMSLTAQVDVYWMLIWSAYCSAFSVFCKKYKRDTVGDSYLNIIAQKITPQYHH